MPALEKAFELAVVISAVDHITGPVTKMAGQLGLLNKQTDAVQKRMAQFKSMTLTGAAITGIGGVMALGLDKAVKSAGELQTAMMGVKDALKLTNSEYQKATNMAQTVGIPTIFSAVQVSGIMKAMGTAGLTRQMVMNPSILRDYVNFADVQAQIKNENAPDVVSSAVNMAHQYQLYSVGQVTPFLNQLNAALLHTHETASEFQTTYKYIAQQARTQGMSASDTLAATAWLGRMGFGNGRGGTNFADFLRRSIYGSSGKKADAAMVSAGFVQNGHSVFETAQGQFVGIPAAVKILQDFAGRFHNNANLMSPLLNSIFGVQGARIAMMMASGGAGEQYTNVQKQIAATASISQAQKDLNNTWAGKVKQLQTTVQDIGQAFGKSVMPVLLPLVKALDNMLAKLLEFEQQHPKIMKFISAFASIATAVLLVVGPMIMLTGAVGYLFTSQAIRVGAIMLGRSFTTMLGPVAILGLAIYGLYLLWTSNFGNIQEKTRKVFSWFKSEIPTITSDIHKLLQALGIEQVSHQSVGMGGRFSAGETTTRKYQIPGWVKDVAVGVAAWKLLSIAITLSRTALVRFLAQMALFAIRMTLLVMWRSTLLAIRLATLAWSAAQWLLNVAMDANPIGTIVLVIGLLVVGIVALILKWKSLVGWLKHVWQWYKNLHGSIKLLLAIFVPFIGLPALIISKWGAIKTFFSDLWSNYIKPVIDGIANSAIGKWVMNHIFGVKSMPTNVNSSGPGISIPPGAQSSAMTNNSTIHVHPGAIQINGSSDPGAVADQVIKKLGTQYRQNNMSRPMGPNRLVFR